jgi:hypothetical protein
MNVGADRRPLKETMHLWGERVHAVIVLRPGMELGAEQVISHCKEYIAGYKCPAASSFASRCRSPLLASCRRRFWASRTGQVVHGE